MVSAPTEGQARLPGETPPDSTRASPVRPDTTRPPFPYGRSLTYWDILRETRLLRRRPEPPPDTTRSVDPTLGIGGLVVDETLTPTGRLFYETFFQSWTPPRGAERSTVTIGEQPLPGNGTAIVIRAEGEILAQARLPRRQEEVETLARQAINFVRQRLSGG
ncbi:MAG: CsgE family curli-type amyloid fiber assembly protein [Bacteroidota bacterium]